jgi:putative NIF3 family GTP cyclohydrolase 1 type 2
VTIRQIVERIRKDGTRTTLHAGSADAAAEGIAVTYTPTLEVLRKSLSSGRNLIVSREGPFWRHKPDLLAANPTYQYKRDFIEKNRLTLIQLLDEPDERYQRALAEALGWSAPGSIYFPLPETSLEALAKSVEAKLKIHAARVLGDPRLKVSKAALTHGRMLVPDLQKVLREPGLDAVIVGEPVEWEAGPYFQDLLATGRKMGLIAIGLEASEEPGGKLTAEWLKSLVPEVPVEWTPTGEPFSYAKTIA